MTGTQENRHCVGRVKGISPLEPSPFLHATPMMLGAAVAPSYCSSQTNDCEELFFLEALAVFVRCMVCVIPSENFIPV